MAIEFGDRLNAVMKEKGISQKELATRMGISRQTVYQWRSDMRYPRPETVEKIAAALGVSPGVLAYGEGSQCLSVEEEGCVHIPQLDVKASCGFGVMAPESLSIVRILTVSKPWVLRHCAGADLSRLAIINIVGDSMQPLFNDGDFVIVDTGVQRVSGEDIYAFNNDSDLFVKRIQRGFDGSATIISENPVYPPITVPAESQANIHIIGRVVTICAIRHR